MIFKFILILVYKKFNPNYIISDYVIAPALDDPHIRQGSDGSSLEVGSKVVKKWSKGGQRRVKGGQWDHFDSDGLMEFEGKI
jgi:hypothetical protein